MALIVLDLPDLLTARVRATASLAAFVACMGLALGMSMLGVMTALAAQWLRGYGAGEGTDDLLARASGAYRVEVAAPPAILQDPANGGRNDNSKAETGASS